MLPEEETVETPRTTEVPVRRLGELGERERAAVHDLVGAARDTDGGEPLAEDARLVVDGQVHPGVEVHHLLARPATTSRSPEDAAGPLAGYAQVRVQVGGAVDEVTVELLVAPRDRRAGVGAALAGAVADVVGGTGRGGEGTGGAQPSRGTTTGRHATLTAWSHGDHPGAGALARRHGLVRERELWRMVLALDGEDDLPPLELPDGVALRSFEPGRDEAGWLALNAAAFAEHPQQGGWDAGDLAARTSAPWFDPAGLLLLVDADHAERLLASHWTKLDGASGEVYVVAVSPAEQGRGLGRAVVLAGLHHLARRGAGEVELYVGGGGPDARARRLYERLGFARAAVDTVHARRW